MTNRFSGGVSRSVRELTAEGDGSLEIVVLNERLRGRNKTLAGSNCEPQDGEGDPLQFLLILLAGWNDLNQETVIEYLQDEAKIIDGQLVTRRRFDDDQRRRLATRAKKISLKHFKSIATIALSGTLLDCHQRRISRTNDSRAMRSYGCPPAATQVLKVILLMAAKSRIRGYTPIQAALQNPGGKIGHNRSPTPSSPQFSLKARRPAVSDWAERSITITEKPPENSI